MYEYKYVYKWVCVCVHACMHACVCVYNNINLLIYDSSRSVPTNGNTFDGINTDNMWQNVFNQ